MCVFLSINKCFFVVFLTKNLDDMCIDVLISKLHTTKRQPVVKHVIDQTGQAKAIHVNVRVYAPTPSLKLKKIPNFQHVHKECSTLYFSMPMHKEREREIYNLSSIIILSICTFESLNVFKPEFQVQEGPELYKLIIRTRKSKAGSSCQLLVLSCILLLYSLLCFNILNMITSSYNKTIKFLVLFQGHA